MFGTAKEVGSVDSQIALLLLRQCGGFCQMVYIARCTPPSVVLKGLQLFDEEFRQSISADSDPSDLVWKQTQLSMSRVGLGASQCIISFSMLGFATNTSHHLLHSLDHFIPVPQQVISIDQLFESPIMTLKMLFMKTEQFQLLFDASSSSIPNRARFMSAS